MAMKRLILRLFTSLVIVVLSGLPNEILAAPYYEGKVIQIIVGFSPGGGYDRMSRMLAKHLPKHIPGKPSIIVDNMAGGGSAIAANYIYNVAKPDGLTIGAIDQGLAFGQLLKVAGVKFDARKFSWVGSTGVEPTILTLRSDLPYKTIEDLRKEKKEVFLGSVGKASTDYQFPILLKEFVGINFNFVIYPGGADINLAIERKELDGRVGSYSSLKPFIERGLLRPFVRCRVSVQGIESLPVDEDLTNDIKGKRLMSMLAAPARLGRPYIAPPGVPNEIMNILWDAFAKVVKDPELKEDAKKNRFEVEYVSADEIQRILNELFNQPPDIIEEFRKYIKF